MTDAEVFEVFEVFGEGDLETPSWWMEEVNVGEELEVSKRGDESIGDGVLGECELGDLKCDASRASSSIPIMSSNTVLEEGMSIWGTAPGKITGELAKKMDFLFEIDGELEGVELELVGLGLELELRSPGLG